MLLTTRRDVLTWAVALLLTPTLLRGQVTTRPADAPNPPATQASPPRKWVVRVLPTEDAQRLGAMSSDHILIQRGATLRVEGPLGDRFEPGTYEERGIDFRAQFTDEFRGVVFWAGELNEGTIRGLIRHTQRDGQILTYRFEGRGVMD